VAHGVQNAPDGLREKHQIGLRDGVLKGCSAVNRAVRHGGINRARR
jgi:hypothetical protein